MTQARHDARGAPLASLASCESRDFDLCWYSLKVVNGGLGCWTDRREEAKPAEDRKQDLKNARQRAIWRRDLSLGEVFPQVARHSSRKSRHQRTRPAGAFLRDWRSARRRLSRSTSFSASRDAASSSSRERSTAAASESFHFPVATLSRAA